jgi:threonine aldolase
MAAVAIMVRIMHRRSFLAAPLAAAQLKSAIPAQLVVAYADGIPHSPAEYAQLLAKLTASNNVVADEYSLGGAVEKLETRMAQMLGKEAAVWLPTGTLANQLAVRLLSGNKRRVLVQAESHLYRDCGDCMQTLSGLTMIPLAEGKATFTLAEVEHAAGDAMLGRVIVPVGAIQIESPVRRKFGEQFDFTEMNRISAWARERRIGMHLDGARLLLECAYTSRAVKEYTALFDTVYVSMYKYFNAASGAILAGPKSLLEGLYHTRRMFGGGLPHAWPFAVVSLHFAEGFDKRMRAAVENAERALQLLAKDSNFEIERVPNGTNIFRMHVVNVNPPVYQGRLEQAGIVAHVPTVDKFVLQVNETWARVPAAEIAARFRLAMG